MKLAVNAIDGKIYTGEYTPCGAAFDNESEVLYAFRDKSKVFLVYGNELSKDELRQFNEKIQVTINISKL